MSKLFLFLALLIPGSNAFAGFPPMQVTAKANSPVQHLYVTKDVGLDTNDCSRFKPCKTIGAGISAAVAAGAAYYNQYIIHVAPSNGGSSSSYTEDVTIAQQGIMLKCDASQANTRACLIAGTLTVNMTGTSGGANFVAASNESYVDGFVISKNNSTQVINFTGTTFQRLILTNCYIDENGTGSAVVFDNSGTSGGTPSALISYDTVFANNNATNPTVNLSSSGRFWMYGTTGVIQQTTSTNKAAIISGATASFIANLVQITGQVQVTSNTATATFNLSTIASGTAACVDTPASPNTGYVLWAYAGCNSSNANAFTGSGVVVFANGNACLSSACSTASTITTSNLAQMPNGSLSIPFSTGSLVTLSTNQIVGYGKTVNALLVKTIAAAAATFTCSVNPQFTLYDCGTSAGACTTGRTALANVTLTAANTGTNGSITSATLAAGHYWAWEVSAGTCTALTANGTVMAAQQ